MINICEKSNSSKIIFKRLTAETDSYNFLEELFKNLSPVALDWQFTNHNPHQ